MSNWKQQLTEMMPLLGHRNWIVITDSAYPLQTNPGITTLYAPEDFDTVLSTVNSIVRNSPHVTPHVWLDAEQKALDEALCPGWNSYKESVATILGGDSAPQYLGHEEIIGRLDEMSKLFKVVIVKTSLAIPYTSVFFELDCGYWDADRERTMRSRL